MKKNFKLYLCIWAIFLVIFNLVTFLTPNEVVGLNKFDGAFWVGYIFITLAFIGQLVTAYFAFKEENMQKLFYKISLMRVSFIGLILTLVFGVACMAIPNVPNWLGIILCFAVLGFSTIAVLKAEIAIEEVIKIDEKIKTQTAFIKLLTVDAQSLMMKAKSSEIKAECKKVYEAVRYSDPMSNDALSSIEGQIQKQFNAFEVAVEGNELDYVKKLSSDLLIAIDSRNKKCRVLK